MFATLLSVALFILPAIQGVAAEFNIDTPDSITACKPIKFNWDDTKGAPYNLVIVESTAPCDDILVELGDHSGTSFTWDKVTIPASFIGKSITLSLEDSNGEEAWSGSIPYKGDGAGNACLSSSGAAGSADSATPGTTTIPYSKPASTPTPTTSAGAVPVGAANAGTDPLSSDAHSVRQTSGSVLLASAFVALLAFSL
jgi:hypothetical protein